MIKLLWQRIDIIYVFFNIYEYMRIKFLIKQF